MSAEAADNRGGDAAPRRAPNRDDGGGLAREAWDSSPARWRAGAVAVGLLALVSTMHPTVPLASGVGVAALLPAALVDRRWQRLPDPLVALAASSLVLVATIEARSGVVIEVRGAVAGAAVVAGPLLAVHLVSPGSMGFGDVKAGIVLGAALGLVHWQVGLAALAVATGLTAIVGLGRRAPSVPLGPGLVVGGAAALAAASVALPGEPDGSMRAAPPVTTIEVST